jgi:hypothetical protein
MARFKSHQLGDLPAHIREQIEAMGIVIEGRPAANEPRFGTARKYGNVPVEQDGQKFPSKLQAARNRYHRVRKALGEIKGHLSEVSMRLPSGKRMRLDEFLNEPQIHLCSRCAVPWTCPSCGDKNLIDTLVLEDSKGIITAEWSAKCAELEAALGIKIRIHQH